MSVLTYSRQVEYIDFHMFETVNNLGSEREKKKRGEIPKRSRLDI